MALIHHTELGRLVVSVLSLSPSLSLCVAVWRNVHRVHWQSRVKPQHICPYVSAATFTSSKVPFDQPSVQPPICASTPCPSLCCGWVCFVDPSVTAVSGGGPVEWCRGGRGVFGRAFPPRREAMENSQDQIRSCGSRQEPSTVGGQLGLNVYSADGAFPAGGQPLVHTRLVEEVHAG